MMQSHGANRFYAKQLAPNDNSKNQVYLGGGFGALNIIPHDAVTTDVTVRAGSVRKRDKADVKFFWIDEEGLSEAPDAQLILYPKYPEVRMSGFLKGCRRAPNDLMRSRAEGRILIFGICPDGRVLGYASAADRPVARELAAAGQLERTGVFLDLEVFLSGGADSRSVLLATLKRIHQKGWIPSQKIGSDGRPAPYSAQNGGGYTLEAELGVSPNGYAEPDFLGWEIKQYGVGDFVNHRPKSPVTLMTPEPTGGTYRDNGVEAFLMQYGYPDKSGKVGRINFGGVYAIGRDFHADTGLKLSMNGYDVGTGKMDDLDGALTLVDRGDRVAASWGFRGMLDHWNRKHAKAAYVPSIKQAPPPEYQYGSRIQLCEGTDFLLFLAAVARGQIYVDPAVKMEAANSSALKIKRRNQFRVKHPDLAALYREYETVSVGA
ncbi:MvaI/BcnI family restriction endonuclease [Pseudohalocynthiibacter aestuariivivens]|uniref:MvaI/BcnI family restriction endonuclease n=1 Tax=Pseudohalocynthiibacter aestuariivivens TaxID=1591409 RepID=A0ABV5JEV0_9RHOB|nr:MvaI/BcnI family restriction endonuclease [Pseudohalocynthiibacter aestuariivivens]MBS9718524.1 hypothetical protein [Pseudohalocynthiibacter aestuariivivens]